MRILVTGEQDWNCVELAVRVISSFADQDAVVISETSGGRDLPCAMAAIDLGLPLKQYPARWGRPGFLASWHRASMIGVSTQDRGGKSEWARPKAPLVKPDLCLAFHRNLARSTDTLDVVRMALMAGVPTYLVDSAAASPRRLDCKAVDLMVWQVTRPDLASGEEVRKHLENIGSKFTGLARKAEVA